MYVSAVFLACEAAFLSGEMVGCMHMPTEKMLAFRQNFFLTFAELKIIAQAIMADATEPCMELALLPEEDDDGKQPLKRPASAVDSDGEGQPVFKKPAGKNNAGKKTAGKKTAGKDNAGNSKKSAGKDNAGKDKKKAGKDNAGQESAGKKTAGKKAAAKAKPKSQPAPKIQAKDKDTFADKARKWKLAQEEEESQDVSDKGSEAGTQVPDSAPKRQLAKARKFKRMSDQQAIPEHIQEAIDKAKSRAEKTEMINELFDIDPKGNIVMKPDKAMFQTMKTASHEKFGKDQTIGMPYEVLLHRDFHGDKEALIGAIERGVVHQWVENGVPFAGYRQTSAGISKTVSDTHSLGGNPMDVTKETSQAIAKAFSSMAFVFGDTEEAPKESSSRDLVVHPGSSSSSSKECEFLACL